MAKEESILDMDFGDLFPISGEGTIPLKASETDPEEDPKEGPEVEEELNVNEILSETHEEIEEEGDDPKKTGTAPASLKDTKGTPSSPFTLLFAEYLKEQGLVSDFDKEALEASIKEEGEPAALSYLIQAEIDANRERLKSEYEGAVKEFLELKESGVSTQEAAGMVLQLENLDKISEDDLSNEDNETLRRQILKANYKETTNFSEARIEKLVNRTFDLGDDVEESKEALENLKTLNKQKIEDRKKAEKTREAELNKQRDETFKQISEKINAINEFIPNQRINKQTKDKLNNLITKPVKQLENGQLVNAIWSKRLEDPIDFDIKLAYLLELGIFDNDWSKVVKSAKTKVVEELEERIKDPSSMSMGNYKPTVRGGSVNTNEGRDLIKSMKSVF